MLRILVPVDGSETSQRAIDFLVKKVDWYKNTVDIHLVNVQHALHGDVSMFVDREQLAQYHHDEGIKALQAARAKLDAVGVPYVFHIGVGEDPAVIIAHYARDKECDQILMGTHGRGAVAGMLMGSTTRKVLHLTMVPLLLVK